MLPVRSILLATDLSPVSHAVFEGAACLAERFGAHVDVVYVWQPPPGVSLGMTTARSRQETVSDVARKHASQQMGELLASSARYKSFHSRIEVGAPHELIVTLAASERHDLIVMGAAAKRDSIGSVTRRVLDSAPCPVLTLRHSPESPLERPGRVS
jgi:universal stress protein E